MTCLVNAKPFGFETFADIPVSPRGDLPKLSAKVAICFRNVMKILGYFIPVVGLIRIVCVIASEDVDQNQYLDNRWRQVVRGFFEVLCLGFVAAIYDCLYYRHEKKESII